MIENLQPYEPIRKIDQDIFCVDGDWYETPLRRRMTIVRLKNGSLVIHSAIRMNPMDMEALDQLGPVETIVIPNVFHDSEAGFYAERYPKAKVFVPEKIKKKCEKKMQVSGTLESDWPLQDELPCISLQRSLISESAFVHVVSNTLILADLSFNVNSTDFKNPLGRLIFGKWNGFFDGFGPSQLTKLVMARDHYSVREFLQALFSYDFDRVIISHGKIVESKGKHLLSSGFERVYGIKMETDKTE